MKKVYERPMMVCDQFTADEFVATCFTAKEPDIFKCASKAWGGAVWYDDGDGVFSFAKDSAYTIFKKGPVLGYQPCGVEHKDESLTTGTVLKRGWVVGAVIDGKADPVYIWEGKSGKNVHCATSITEGNYTESNKS